MGAVSRGALLHAAAVGGAALLGAGALTSATARSAPSRARDARLLAPVVALKRRQVNLYEWAAQTASIGPELRELARVVAAHERAHLATIEELVAGPVGDEPAGDIGATTADDETFARLAIRLEDLCVLSLNGQAAHLTPEALEVTAGIASVDARHAAWLRGVIGVSPAHHVLDTGWSSAEVSSALGRNGLGPGIGL
jgi:hypothetical protein